MGLGFDALLRSSCRGELNLLWLSSWLSFF